MNHDEFCDMLQRHVDECVAFLSRASILPFVERQKTIDLLEQCVSHKLLLKVYLQKLQGILRGKDQCNNMITIERAHQCSRSGLSDLNDIELAMLALDPVSLWSLHDVIDDEFQDRWIETVIKADEQWEKLEITEDSQKAKTKEFPFPWADLDLISADTIVSLMQAGTR